MLLYQVVSVGGDSFWGDSRRTMCQASGTGKNGSGCSVGVGKRGKRQDSTQVCPGQGATLSAGAVALSGAVPGRW